MKIKRILLPLILLTIIVAMIGCSKEDASRALWDEYTTAMNSKDFNAVANLMFYRDKDNKTFLDFTTSEDYFGDFVSVETLEFNKTVDCNLSTTERNEYYGAAEVKVNVVTTSGAEEKTINVYYEWIFDLSSKIDKLGFCSSVPDEKNKANVVRLVGDSLGNTPSSNWSNKAYYLTDEFNYQIIKGQNTSSVVINEYLENERNVEIPAQIDGMNVTTITQYAFYKKAGVINITVPTSKMRHLTLPNTLTTIEKYAFYQCTSLEEIYIPSSVKKIGDNAFTGCKKVEKITLDVNDSSAYLKLNDVDSVLNPNSEYDIEIVGARNLYVGDIISLSTIVEDIVEDKSIKWTTTSSAITVDAKGNVRAVSAGANIVITATLISGDNPYNCATVTLSITNTPSLLEVSSNTFDRCVSLKELYVNAINPKSITITGLGMKLSSDAVIYVPYGSGPMYKVEWSMFEEQIEEMPNPNA